ncbi:hypothetical protein ACFY0B_26050 [Streptomyces sp. NPDC001797]|uniref:hypothetical protein n=1 Tax=Streptomyces sp. NPDC001797 TaxID=3364610 RepID=UPI0036D0EF18
MERPPIAATLAAAGLTYWCWVRPVLRGRHDTAPATHGCSPPSASAPDLDERIRQATAERDRLRDDLGAKPAP